MRHILPGVPTLLAIPLALAAANVNTAMTTGLEALPDIGLAKAKAIIIYRQQNGRLRTVEGLKRVKGIGEGIFSRLKDETSVVPPAAKKAVSAVKQQ